MIRIKIGKIFGIAIEPFLSSEEEDIIKWLKHSRRKAKVAFVDLAATDQIKDFILKLSERHEVEVFFDHHWDASCPELFENMKVITKAMSEPKVKFVTRDFAPSCCGLVESGEWKRLGINVVFFHDDFDGFSSYLRGCGVEYKEMLNDANLTDGGRVTADNGACTTLSVKGKFIHEAFYLVPSSDQDPYKYRIKKRDVYQIISDWLSGHKRDDFMEFVKNVRHKAEKVGKFTLPFVLKTKLLLGKIALCDFRDVIRAGRQIALPLWKQEVINRLGNVLLCYIGIGHLGEQVYIELPSAWRGKEIDLRDFLPEGVVGRVSGRVQVPLESWDDFLKKWDKGRILSGIN